MEITNKLEVVNKLQKCEEKKEQFQMQLKALESQYLKECTIVFQTDTGDFQHKGTKEPVEFNKVLMIEYIRKEIEELQKESNNLIAKLAFV